MDAYQEANPLMSLMNFVIAWTRLRCIHLCTSCKTPYFKNRQMPDAHTGISPLPGRRGEANLVHFTVDAFKQLAGAADLVAAAAVDGGACDKGAGTDAQNGLAGGTAEGNSDLDLLQDSVPPPARIGCRAECAITSGRKRAGSAGLWGRCGTRLELGGPTSETAQNRQLDFVRKK